jgi:hypothetical protein
VAAALSLSSSGTARNISGGDVRTITSLSGDARIMQLAVRFTF